MKQLGENFTLLPHIFRRPRLFIPLCEGLTLTRVRTGALQVGHPPARHRGPEKPKNGGDGDGGDGDGGDGDGGDGERRSGQ